MIKKIFNFYKECPARMKQLDISPRNIEKKFDTLNAGDGLDIATQLGRGGMLFIASPPPCILQHRKFIYGGNF